MRGLGVSTFRKNKPEYANLEPDDEAMESRCNLDRDSTFSVVSPKIHPEIHNQIIVPYDIRKHSRLYFS